MMTISPVTATRTLVAVVLVALGVATGAALNSSAAPSTGACSVASAPATTSALPPQNPGHLGQPF